MSAPRRVHVAVVAVLTVIGLVLATPGPRAMASLAPSDPTAYRPPVVAPVLDRFRPPPAPWLPGNRGIEYATLPGTPVRAIGPGVVVFAGLVAGERDVTVRHPDGLRSSYVDLALIRVRKGDAVAAGDVVGLSTDRLHLGVRRGDTYLDPDSLWGREATGHVVLVPTTGDLGGDRRSAVPGALPDHPPPRSAGPSAVAVVRGLGRMLWLGPAP
jgi:murein DD-endopeptidase MepM/ murein hydrolase activator NlpD